LAPVSVVAAGAGGDLGGSQPFSPLAARDVEAGRHVPRGERPPPISGYSRASP